MHLQQVQHHRQAQFGVAQQCLGAGEYHARVSIAHRRRSDLRIGVGLEETHLRRMFLAALPVALEVALLVHHQGVVGHGLLGPAAVLGQVDAASLGFHVEEACCAVVGHHGIAVVVEQPVELVEVAMAHALHGVLLHQRLAAFAAHAQDRQTAAFTVRAIAQQHRPVVERFGLVGRQRLRHLQPFR
ncbi:hypothetical protein D3C73_755340 [compost metagenome]